LSDPLCSNKVEVLSDRLRDVWIGSFKLQVNLSRFGRNESKESPSQETYSEGRVLEKKEIEHGRSFRAALVGDGSSSKSQIMKVPMNEELCKELQCGVLGKLAREKDVRRIQTTLFMEGFRSISVTHMGVIWLSLEVWL
jgi:hypothetical protein